MSYVTGFDGRTQILGQIVPPHQITADRLAYLNDSDDHHLADYRPGWDDDTFTPSPEAEAESEGFGIGYEGIDGRPPAALSTDLKAFWMVGYADGVAQRRADIEEREMYEADLAESVYRWMERDQDEAVRAMGVLASREGEVAL